MAIGKKVNPCVLSVQNFGTNEREFIRVRIVIPSVLQNFKTVGLNAGINIRRQIVFQLVEAARKFSAVVFRIGLEELADLPQLIDINGPPRLDDGWRGSPLVQLLPQLLVLTLKGLDLSPAILLRFVRLFLFGLQGDDFRN